MAEKLALPLLLPKPPLHPNPSSSPPHAAFASNRRLPRSPHGLSYQGQQILQTLIEPSFNSNRFDEVFPHLFQQKDSSSLSRDILGIIKGLRFNNKFDLALSLFDWVRRRDDCVSLLNGSVIAVIVSILGRAGRVSHAASLLHNLETSGVEVDADGYTSLINAYAYNKSYKEALKVFSKMKEIGCGPTLITYNSVLKVYGKMGMPWTMIIALLQDMKSHGIAPDLCTYNTLIRCCCAGSLYEEALDLFEEIKLAGFKPDIDTYNALLDVYGKCRRPKEAMEVLKQIESNNLRPNLITYNSLIWAYVRGGLFEEAMELKTRMVEKGIKPNVYVYNTILSGFVNAGEDESAMEVYDEMRVVGCKPNICTFNVLIMMYGARGKFEEMEKVFKEIKECKCSPNMVTWNTLLAAFGQNGMDSDVSRLFEEMKRAGFAPERDTFNTLIIAYGRCGSLDKAMAAYKRMLEDGVTPDLSTYNAVLVTLGQQGLWEQCEKVLSEVKDSGCKPNAVSYSSLLHAYANGKEFERMNALAEEIYCGTIKTHPFLLKTLVLVSSKVDLLVETERAFMELRKRGILPDITTLNAMISIYGRKKMVSKTNEILSFMSESGLTLSGNGASTRSRRSKTSSDKIIDAYGYNINGFFQSVNKFDRGW